MKGNCGTDTETFIFCFTAPLACWRLLARGSFKRWNICPYLLQISSVGRGHQGNRCSRLTDCISPSSDSSAKLKPPLYILTAETLTCGRFFFLLFSFGAGASSDSEGGASGASSTVYSGSSTRSSRFFGRAAADLAFESPACALVGWLGASDCDGATSGVASCLGFFFFLFLVARGT